MSAEHPVAHAEDVPIGEGRVHVVAGQQIAMFRLRDGKIRAVQAICPHAGGPLADGMVDDTVVICPLHNHTFDLATGCSTTGQPSIRTYPTHVDDHGNIIVSVPQLDA